MIIAAATLAVGLTACGGGGHGPATTLGQYSAALRKQDYGAAYEMMSASYRDQHSKDEFVRMMKENAGEASDTAERLRTARGDYEVTAEFDYGHGDTLRMVRENGAWRIASNPIDFYNQTTPRDALRSFLRAYELKRWDIMLRFIPDKYREPMTVQTLREQFEGVHKDEIREVMKALANNVANQEIREKGDEARMPYGERFEVKFVREDGLWKIQDID